MGDIEFAVDINNSLIAQVRQLQAVISERDEALKTAILEKAPLELEAEGFAQRLKSLDESEQRYKDENWALETQIHDLISEVRDAASREQKLQLTLAHISSEKSEAQRELDDLKQNHGRLTEDLTATRKNHDTELATLRRNLNSGESEKGLLQKRVEDLTTQNQELAKALAAHFRNEENEPEKEADSSLGDDSQEKSELEHSPPPSPTKGIPRHAILESETLKSSLNHAHRMIQNLKGNVHREKTEKLELKRMLQEAKDELEIRRSEANHDNKRLKSKPQQDAGKKGMKSSMLGQGRSNKTDILPDETEWEDQNDIYRSNVPRMFPTSTGVVPGAYQTATETEDAFETANEPDSTTESEAFQTGAESIAGESSDTETEGGVNRGGTVRAPRPASLTLAKAGDRLSYGSTASTDEDELNIKTPVQTHPQRYRLKINRGTRKSRVSNEPTLSSGLTSARNSPASFVGSSAPGGQSLFAELGGLDDHDSGEEDGTPSRSIRSNRSNRSLNRSISRHRSTTSLGRSASSRRGTPLTGSFGPGKSFEEPPIPKLPPVDTGVMTEPWEPISQIFNRPSYVAAGVEMREAGTETDPWEPTQKLTDQQSLLPTTAGENREASIDTDPWKTTKPGIDHPSLIGAASGMDQYLSRTTASSPFVKALTDSGTTMQQPGDRPNVLGPAVDSNQETDALAESWGSIEKTNRGSTLRFTPHKRGASDASVASIIKSTQLPEHPLPETTKALPVLKFSPIRSLEIVPTETQAKAKQKEKVIAETPKVSSGGSETSGSQVGGLFDTARIIDTIFGTNRTKNTPAPQSTEDETSRGYGTLPSHGPFPNLPTPQIAEDETSQDFTSLPTAGNGETNRPFRELPHNNVQQLGSASVDQENAFKRVTLDMADHSAQTVLSSEQIESLIQQKDKSLTTTNQKQASASTMKDSRAVLPPLPTHRYSESMDRSRGKQTEHGHKEAGTFTRAPKRPLSSASIRSRTGQYPPLPADHQQAIAAAAQRAPSIIEPSTTSMGPPLAPASAYRSNTTRTRTPSRPRTPSDARAQSSVVKGGTTPRPRHSNSARSQISRRSSVSSFASELDERFNIRVDGMGMGHGLEGSTDPRMIQAITQTMIGEYLWKYTRKAGRGELSSNRHRRFFWVHPYTRTLYWSDKDPSTAGRAEIKATSVAIEAVQVVTDDNPMPPGLHRKSLVIITPGRSVKLTATTGQRHETWFNALSYLLLRTGPEAENAEAGNTAVDDNEEFNPSYSRRVSRTVASRISLASFRSNASQRSLNTRLASTKSPASAQTAQSASVRSRYSQPQLQPSRNQGSLSSRLSGYWKPGSASARASVSSRRSAHQQHGQDSGWVSEGNATVDHDSAEGVRHVLEQQERDADQLENVRACCDGE